MKRIEILLKPEDFDDTNFGDPFRCALANAAKKYFGKNCTCCEHRLRVWKGNPWCGVLVQSFDIPDQFTEEDYEFIKAKYRNPKCDTDYYVTLIPQQ